MAANEVKLSLLKARQAELRAEREEQQERAFKTLKSLESINEQIAALQKEGAK